MHELPLNPSFQDDLLHKSLNEFLGEVDPELQQALHARLQWVEVAGGSTLIEQGEPGDAMYLPITGRLRAYVRGGDGQPRVVREIGRGQVIGEMSLYTDAPRSASIIAIRDSVLARLDKADFMQLLASSPQVSVALTRQIIRRLQREDPRSKLSIPVMVGLVPVTADVDAAAFAAGLAAAMNALPGARRLRVVGAEAIDTALGVPGISHHASADAEANRRVSLLLEQIESENDVVLLVADDAPTPWTQRCTRYCDEVLLLANATQPPALHRNETECLLMRKPRTEAAEVLLLLHPPGTVQPRGTQRWLARRPVADHVHLRQGHAPDLARLARIQSRTAVGLVLAGGGARGFAHLGAWKALREAGVPIDFVGGTSIGAVMGLGIANDLPYETVADVIRRSFDANPTGDFNPFPLISLIQGRRLRLLLRRAIHDLLGFEGDIEDVWKTFYCVATNYSQSRETVLRQGPLERNLLASVAIPGALPPVVMDGDLLYDGGALNNFPVDVMQGTRGVGRIIGIDLHAGKSQRFDFEQMPSSWALLRDRLRPRGRRLYNLPSLIALLLNASVLYSHSRRREAQRMVDLYVNPPLERVGMLAWRSMDRVANQGYEHMAAQLRQMPPEELQALGAEVPPGLEAVVPGRHALTPQAGVPDD